MKHPGRGSRREEALKELRALSDKLAKEKQVVDACIEQLSEND